MALRSDPRRLWDDENMQKATAAVEQGGASIHHAAEKYGTCSTLPIQATYHTFHTSYTAYLPMSEPTMCPGKFNLNYRLGSRIMCVL